MVTEMAINVAQNERTAMAQQVTRQPDGPGLRIGNRGEISGIGKVAPGGAQLFRERLPQVQAEAAYWEKLVGTAHEFRVFLFDNDTRIFFTVLFDGDFKPYFADFSKAFPWFDQMFLGVWEGYKGMKEPGFTDWFLPQTITAEFFYAAYPEATRRDVERMQRLDSAVSEMLDAAS